jgi:hypothetical protein
MAEPLGPLQADESIPLAVPSLAQAARILGVDLAKVKPRPSTMTAEQAQASHARAREVGTGQAAKELGLSSQGLHYLWRKHGLKAPGQSYRKTEAGTG